MHFFQHHVAALISAFTFLSASAVATAPPVVHAVLISDTSPAAQWGQYSVNVTMDVTNMFSAICNSLPESQRQIYSLSLEEDEWSTPENILQQIKEITLTPADTLLVYYSGHGAADDHGHFFRLAKGNLYRNDLRRAMERKQARLNVLLSDCCNLRSDGFAYFAPGIQETPPTQPTRLMNTLLLQPIGWVDVNASSPGEAAFFKKAIPGTDPFSDPRNMPGSLFTTALTDLLQKRRDLSLEWPELLRELNIDVHLSFRENYPKGASPSKGLPLQTGQHVYAIEYPGMPEKSGPRTGLIVRDYRGTGVLITKVPENSPGSRVFDVSTQRYITLQSGYVILAANDDVVRTTSDLQSAVNRSPQLMRLRVQDESGRGSRECLMTLRY